MKTGLWLLATAIILGAIGAHGLQALVTPERLETWDTAVRYHVWISLFHLQLPGRRFKPRIGYIDWWLSVFWYFRARYTCWFCLIPRSWGRSLQSVAF